MPRTGLILLGLFLSAALLPAQPGGTPAPTPFDPAKYPEDWLLAKWEDAMSKVDSLVAECQYTLKDNIFKATDVYTGTAKYLRTKTGIMASLELYKEVKKGVQSKDSFKKTVYTGTYLYDFIPADKVIRVYELPKPAPGQGVENNLLSMMFGMRAVDAKKRYKLEWKEPDAHYYYLEVTAIDPKDKQEFSKARLVLLKSNFMLRQVWLLEGNNSNAQIWEFTPKLNAPLKASDFAAPSVPFGWRMEKAVSVGAVGAVKAPGK